MKRFWTVTAIGVCLGIFLLLVKNIFQIPDGSFVRYYFAFALIIIVGAFLFNLVYIFVFQKKLSKAVKLFDAGEIDRYMEALEHLRRSAKGKYLNHLYAINLSAGYCEWKQYDRAIALLEPLSATRFSNRMVKMVHHLNLCMCYFYNDI